MKTIHKAWIINLMGQKLINEEGKILITDKQEIRRQLGRKVLTDYQLKQKVDAYRDNLWVYGIAIKNLKKAREIALDKKNKRWKHMPQIM